MQQEPLQFKKSGFSGTQSNCVEVAHTLTHLRDSKHPAGASMRGEVRALIDAVKADHLAP